LYASSVFSPLCFIAVPLSFQHSHVWLLCISATVYIISAFFQAQILWFLMVTQGLGPTTFVYNKHARKWTCSSVTVGTKHRKHRPAGQNKMYQFITLAFEWRQTRMSVCRKINTESERNIPVFIAEAESWTRIINSEKHKIVPQVSTLCNIQRCHIKLYCLITSNKL